MRAIAAALATVALLTACGGGSGSSQPAGSHSVAMTEFAYNPSTMSVPAGKVTFWLVNSGSVAHDMIIRDGNNNRVAASELVSAGDSQAFTVDNLAAGEYTFFCDQPGHEASGMKGKLTVT
jgi:plastocyanin